MTENGSVRMEVEREGRDHQGPEEAVRCLLVASQMHAFAKINHQTSKINVVYCTLSIPLYVS